MNARIKVQEAMRSLKIWEELDREQRNKVASVSREAECQPPSPNRYGDEESYLTKFEYRVEMKVFREKRLEARRRRNDARREETSKNISQKRKRKQMRQISSTTDQLTPNDKPSEVYTSSESDEEALITKRIMEEPDLYF